MMRRQLIEVSFQDSKLELKVLVLGYKSSIEVESSNVVASDGVVLKLQNIVPSEKSLFVETPSDLILAS